MMHVGLLCLCEVASTDGLMPFLVACHCTVFIANVLFCFVMYLANKFLSLSSQAWRVATRVFSAVASWAWMTPRRQHSTSPYSV